MKKLTKEQFASHILKEHTTHPLSTHLKEIVYGGIDGIVTTFAVVAGFSGAQTVGADPTLPTLAVLLFGFANLFGDASSMGLGNFLSVRAEQDVYKKEQEKELREIEENPEYEIRETQYMLTEKGFTESQAEQLTSMYATNKDFWVEFMMREELEMQNPLQDNPMVSAIVTASSFMVFGFIPLIPYVFFRGVFSNQFAVSISFTFAALICLGFVRLKVANQGFIRSVGETVLIGCISAGVAYVVGTFFRV